MVALTLHLDQSPQFFELLTCESVRRDGSVVRVNRTRPSPLRPLTPGQGPVRNAVDHYQGTEYEEFVSAPIVLPPHARPFLVAQRAWHLACGARSKDPLFVHPEQLQRRMEASGVTYWELAKLLGVHAHQVNGLSPTALSRLPVRLLLALAERLDLDRDAVARTLHAAGPVVAVDLNGVNALAVTHHEPLRTVLADRDGTFVRGDATRNWRALREGEVDPVSPLARLRSPLQTHFIRRRVETLRPRVEEITGRLLSDLDGIDAVDVKERLAWPLTVEVLVELLGIGAQDAPVLGNLARRLFELTDASVFPDSWAFLRKLVAERRENLGDDLVSALIVTDAEARPADRLGDEQIVANVFLLFMAGFETTMGTLTNGIRALLEHPDQWARVTGGEVEWDARGHLAFGHGPHLCLGAPLARLELDVALRALFEHFPHLALDPRRESTAPVESWMMHHPQELWVLPHGAPG